MNFTVAIDGPAAAGKGTISRKVAEEFGFGHLDTGLLYRAVGIKALEVGRGVIDPIVSEELARRLSETDITRKDLRGAMAARAASKVAVLDGVRAALLDFQRQFSRREGGAVLDGRDIGTVICPQAEVKIFVTASDATRAQRRFDELIARGEDTTVERVASDLSMRDARDSQRDTAPLVQAEDSVLLDTTEMGIDEAVSVAVKHVEAALAG